MNESQLSNIVCRPSAEWNWKQSERADPFIHNPRSAMVKWVCAVEGCGYKTAIKTHAIRHYHTHLGEDRMVHVCSVCDSRFVRRDQLERHTRGHGDQRPYRCPIPGCSYRGATRPDTLSLHIVREHLPPPQRMCDGRYRCNECLEVFPTKVKFDRHFVREGGRPGVREDR